MSDNFIWAERFRPANLDDDKVVYRVCAEFGEERGVTKWWQDYGVKQIGLQKSDTQFKLTYDGETGKLKSVEIV